MTLKAQLEDVDALVKAWTDDFLCFKELPGYISTPLHRGIGGSTVFLNPAFTTKKTVCPASAEVSPHLFQKPAVPQLCVN